MITFKQFIAEGGWSNTATQDTKLTPAIAKKAVAVLPRFEKDFNHFLKQKGLPEIKVGKPVGSSAYIERDLKSNPTKEYGDIDVLMVIPRLDGTTESKNSSLYADAVKEFAAAEDRGYMLQDPKNFGNAIIVKVGDDEWAQVDLVRTFGEHEEWAMARMTPEHGLKGALLGNLYTSFGQLMNIGIGPSGVFAKEKGGFLVPTQTLRPEKYHNISLDIGQFGRHIVEFVAKRAKVENVRFDKLLKSGMDRSNIRSKDLADVIKGVGRTFELNKMFGEGPLKDVANYDEFIDKIKTIYLEKNAKAAEDKKFDKAGNDEARKRAAETKDLLINKSKQIANLLD